MGEITHLQINLQLTNEFNHNGRFLYGPNFHRIMIDIYIYMFFSRRVRGVSYLSGRKHVESD